MGRLVISRADYRATSARSRTTAHPTVVRRFLCSGYVLGKNVSCETAPVKGRSHRVSVVYLCNNTSGREQGG
jgi:hypothetical protein